MSVLDHYAEIVRQIRLAEKFADRSENAVALMAVTKTCAPEAFLPLLEAGHTLFGENRVQEAVDKWTPLKIRFPAASLHLIGHLQKNKVKEAVALFDAIDSVDNEELAEKLARESSLQGRRLSCCVQVNTGEESQKSGVAPQNAVALVRFCRDAGLTVDGLMCVPPVDDEPSPHFALLKKLAAQADVTQLSMGMSHDFLLAIEQGATVVRVGTSLFGQRPYPQK